ncbi:Uncharacterized protein APZ42_034199 [Daphnia magna]|uniref:Uncharacterized protein n=1 Tax=Daphnia magna TaxID=35525 RepID=A0A164KCM8_9CRUS|nr:Uncharacterized protein APZ42_034199 [Daphnia magna]
MEKLHGGKVSEKATTKIVERKSQSASSLLKSRARRDRGNEFKKFKRLKQPFAGTGMVKLGH